MTHPTTVSAGTFSDPDFRPFGPDSGYSVDSDLHQMSDDGGPVGPDPARWSDPACRDRDDALMLA